MGRVTIHASGSDHQSTLQKPLPMDAHLVSFDDLPLVSCVSDRRLLSLSMALSAQIRDVPTKNRGLRIVRSLGVVDPVAIVAIRSNRIASRVVLAVLARLIIVDLGGVAHGAIHLAAIAAYRVSRRTHIGVTFDAGIDSVNRVVELLVIDVERDFLPVDDLVQILVLVTGHAKGIGKALLVKDAPYVVRLVAVDADG